MNRRLVISVLAVYFIAIASAGVLCAYTELDTAPAIRAEGQIPLTSGPLLDNFNSGTTVNMWGAITGAFNSISPAATCTVSFTTPAESFGGTGHSLKLNYNISATNSYSGYYSKLASVDLSQYNAVSFYVKGDAAGVFFKIQLTNNSATEYWDPGNGVNYYRNTASIYITDYLDGGVTTSWQKVKIPFDNFANLDGWGSMKELVIVFENFQSVANGSPIQGTVYIDDIIFEAAN